MPEKDLPKYSDLPMIDDAGDRYSWGLFGDDDQLGTINLLTSEAVKSSAGSVKKGKVFNLSLPLDLPNPPLSSERHTYKHEIVHSNRNSRDDKVDDFYLQASSQWDALRHMRYRQHGYYNGYEEEAVEAGALGINHYAEHGIVGRGVVLDMGRFMEKRGTPLDYRRENAFEAPVLREALASQGVEVSQGDILVLRTGWMGYFLSHSEEERARFPRTLAGPDALITPGLKATRESAEFIWDSGFAAVVADNPAVEDTPGSPETGFLHRRLLPLLGLAIGELFVLDALAEDCAADGIYECMLVGVPLNLPRGVGSPANAIAIK